MISSIVILAGTSGRRKKRKLFGFPQFQRVHRVTQLQYPEQLDEAFFREQQYCLHEKEITGK